MPIAGKTEPKSILIDCDPGIDDAVALLCAFASPGELDIRLVSTVAGNVPLERVSANALALRSLARRQDVPIHAGADRPLERAPLDAARYHGADGMGGVALPAAQGSLAPEHAVEAIVHAVERAAPALTICALGPLTNLALALRRLPDLGRRVERIVLMGGAALGGNVTPFAEFNIFADPHAAAAVFGCGAEITMLGLDVTRQARVTEAWLAVIGRSGSACARLTQAIYGSRIGHALHDACVIAWMLDPRIFRGRPARVSVELEPGERLGATKVAWQRDACGTEVLDHVDADAMFVLLADRLGRR
jgi:purine nucleosidase